MSKQVLTDRAVAAAKADSGRLERWDLRSPGLCLRVTDRGVKTWIYRYRVPDGRQPRFTIGKFPSIGLKEQGGRAHLAWERHPRDGAAEGRVRDRWPDRS